MMSTLLLYMRISLFSIIYNILTTFSSTIQFRQYCRMCFEPLQIYTMSFWPFLTISNDLWCLHAYIWLIAPSMDYLCIPHTIVYLFNVFQTLSDFVSTLFIFADINIPMFQLFIVLADCNITIGSDSDPYRLLVVSDPSDAISTSPMLFLLIFT